MSPDLPYTRWLLEQISDNSARSSEMAAHKVQILVTALRALRGRGGAQILGLSFDRVEQEGRADVEAAVVEALLGWKRHFSAEGDSISLSFLDEVGTLYGVAVLRLQKRFPLRCDPLGSRDGLSAAWLARLDRLEEAKNGRRSLDLIAVEVVGADTDDFVMDVEFGPPDERALYEHALRYESGGDGPFPRELAAFWTVANGISVGGDPFLRPVAGWTLDLEAQLCIGCGGYMQGSLVFEDPPGLDDLMAAPVVDRDDDGVERARYTDFAALVDALLGT